MIYIYVMSTPPSNTHRTVATTSRPASPSSGEQGEEAVQRRRLDATIKLMPRHFEECQAVVKELRERGADDFFRLAANEKQEILGKMRAFQEVFNTAVARVAAACGIQEASSQPASEEKNLEDALPMRNLSQLPDDSFCEPQPEPMEEEEEEEPASPLPAKATRVRRKKKKAASPSPSPVRKRKQPASTKKTKKAAPAKKKKKKRKTRTSKGSSYQRGQNIPETDKCHLDCGKKGPAMIQRRRHPDPPADWLAEGQKIMDKPLCNACWRRLDYAKKKRERLAAEKAEEDARVLEKAQALVAMNSMDQVE